MANWQGLARSNYFTVKDEEAFRATFEGVDVEILEEDGKFGLLSTEDDTGAWPTYTYDEETDEENDDFDVIEEVIPHLAEGSVAVFIEAGHEKARYISGYAYAVNSKGERRAVNLNDIYKLAAELGSDVTEAEY